MVERPVCVRLRVYRRREEKQKQKWQKRFEEKQKTEKGERSGSYLNSLIYFFFSGPLLFFASHYILESVPELWRHFCGGDEDDETQKNLEKNR